MPRCGQWVRNSGTIASRKGRARRYTDWAQSERSVAMERSTCNESTCNIAGVGEYTRGKTACFPAVAGASNRSCTDHSTAAERLPGLGFTQSLGGIAALPACHRRSTASLSGEGSTAGRIVATPRGRAARPKHEGDNGHHTAARFGTVGCGNRCRAAGSSSETARPARQSPGRQRRVRPAAAGNPAGRRGAQDPSRGFAAVLPVSRIRRGG